MADADGSHEPAEVVPEKLETNRAPLWRKVLIGVAALVVAMLVSLFVNPGQGLFSPAEVAACYELWIAQFTASLAAPFDVLDGSRLVYFHGDYFAVVSRIGATFAAALGGMAAAVAGQLLQTALRKRIALVQVTGVSSAAALADAILVLVFGSASAALFPARWLVGAAVAGAVVALFFWMDKRKDDPLAARVHGRRGAMLGLAAGYFAVWSVWEVFAGVQAGFGGAPYIAGWVVLVLVCAAGLVVSIVLRSRMNGFASSEEETKLAGVDTAFTRSVALACAVALLVVAQVQLGPIALFAAIVPAVSRRLFGADFGDCLIGSVLIGAVLAVLCGYTGCTAIAANACALAMLAGAVILQRA